MIKENYIGEEYSWVCDCGANLADFNWDPPSVRNFMEKHYKKTGHRKGILKISKVIETWRRIEND